MNHLLSILLTAILCASASAQTIKTLGFNSTNGQVVANTGTNVLTFTNDVRFASGDLQVSGTQISGAVLLVDFDDGAISGPITINTNSSVDFLGSSAATTRANLGFSTNLNTFWSATNASNARSAIGLGTTNAVEFSNVSIGGSGQMYLQGAAGSISFYDAIDAEIVLQIPADTDPVVINGQWNDSSVRSNLGLPLAALTNTSNVTMMRALTGSTNTNHPYSGSISVTGTNNTNTLVFSNGILQSVQ